MHAGALLKSMTVSLSSDRREGVRELWSDPKNYYKIQISSCNKSESNLPSHTNKADAWIQ